MAEPAWREVLDDLEHRLAAAEAGELAALDSWAAPVARPMEDGDRHRATGILARQRALLGRLRTEQAEVATAMSGLRRPRHPAATSATPVYLDRLG